MIFTAGEDTDIIILLAILLGLMMSKSQSLSFILKSLGSVSKFWHYVFTYCVFSCVKDISRLTYLIFNPKNSISCIAIKTDFFHLIIKHRCCNKKIDPLKACHPSKYSFLYSWNVKLQLGFSIVFWKFMGQDPSQNISIEIRISFLTTEIEFL